MSSAIAHSFNMGMGIQRTLQRGLLDQRFCDLDIALPGSQLEKRIAKFHLELSRHDIALRPHYWFSTEWFAPDGITGIAVPFYLAKASLTALERRQMGCAEGSSERECLKLLRHEMGHVLCTAFRLHYKPCWRQVFGRAGAPYPDYYEPDVKSRDYVLHLDDWYAQSHPAEDFAETFAVWLGESTTWRSDYRSWPALAKLEYVDALMRKHVCGKAPKVRSRRKIDESSQLPQTLREHYRNKRANRSKARPGLFMM